MSAPSTWPRSSYIPAYILIKSNKKAFFRTFVFVVGDQKRGDAVDELFRPSPDTSLLPLPMPLRYFLFIFARYSSTTLCRLVRNWAGMGGNASAVGRNVSPVAARRTGCSSLRAKPRPVCAVER